MPKRTQHIRRVKPKIKIIDSRQRNLLFNFIDNVLLGITIGILSGLIVGMLMLKLSDFYLQKNALFNLLHDVQIKYESGPVLRITDLDILKILKIETRFAFMGHEDAARDTGRIRIMLEESIKENDAQIFMYHYGESLVLASSLSPDLLQIIKFWHLDIIHQ